MQKVREIGADVGNDALKIVQRGEKELIKHEIMNIISLGYERRVFKGNKKTKLVNLLDVNIYVQEKDSFKDLGRYFVGGLAFSEARGDLIEKTAEDVKAESEYTLKVLLTGLAYALYDIDKETKHENIELGSVLPIEEYFEEGLEEKFKNQLLNKTYKVKFNAEEFGQAEKIMTFTRVNIEAEGIAASYSYTYDFDGSKKEDMDNLENETHLGIDIGSITTEVAVLENGEFNPKGLFGLDIGTSIPLDQIAADLENEHQVELSRHQLDYMLRKQKELKINNGSEIIDLTEKLDKMSKVQFDYFIKLVVSRINKEFNRRGVNTKFFNRVTMCGGGAVLSFDKFKNEFKKGNVVLAKDPRYANAIGALTALIINKSYEDEAAAEVLS